MDSHIQDSLQSLVRTAEKDSNLVNLYLDLSRSYYPGNIEEAIRAAKAAYHLAGQLEYPKGAMKSSAALGVLYKGIAEFDSAMLFLMVSIRLADSLDDQHQLVKNYNDYGSLLRRKGFHSSALEYHRKSLQLSRKIGDTLNWANAAIYAAMISQDRLEYDTAIHYYYAALRIYESLGHKRNIGIAYLNIGDVYYELEEPQSALRFYRKGLPLFLETHDMRNAGLSYNKIGTIHSFNSDYDSALYFYRRAYGYYDSIDNRSGKAHVDINIGNAYSNKGLFREAEPYYQNAIEAFSTMGYLRGYQNGLMSKAGSYMDQGRWQEALDIYLQCIEIARQIDPQALLGVYSGLVDIYRELGNPGKALEYQDLFIGVKDSVFQLEKVEAMADTELKYEKEKDQARILAMERDSLEKDIALEKRTRQRNSYLFSGTGILLILIFLFSYYSQRARKNKIIADQRIHQLEEEKKLLAARSIVEGQEEERKRIARELHDGLGVLLSSAKMHFTSIRDNSPDAQPMIRKATELLEQASGDVRRISHNMMPGLLSKYGLFEAIEDLFDQLGEMEGIKAEFAVTGPRERLPENAEIMLYRIIQEMANNTLKHSGAKNIRLAISRTDSGIGIDYADDGKGFDFAEKIREKSMGLTGLQSRVKFLGGELAVRSARGEGVRYTFMVDV